MDLGHLSPAPVPFRSTLRSLRSLDERDRRAWTPALGGWRCGRSGLAATIRCGDSDTARQAEQSTFQIAAPVDGTITRADLKLDKPSRRGRSSSSIRRRSGWRRRRRGPASTVFADIAALDRAKGETTPPPLIRRGRRWRWRRRRLSAEAGRSRTWLLDASTFRLLAAGLVAVEVVQRARRWTEGARWEVARLAWQRAGKAREVQPRGRLEARGHRGRAVRRQGDGDCRAAPEQLGRRRAATRGRAGRGHDR